ncbi:MAG: 6-bladed beta-propeller [Gammaproteobacteria bacterium]|nr:6-bladed beta-propeller [Gammaproteobacteria bacterium]
MRASSVTGRFTTLIGSLLAVAGCSTAPARVQLDIAPEQGIRWPAAPDPARITFLGEFRTPADLGVTKTAWQRISDLVAGSAPDALVQPMAVVATDDRGRVYVADPGAGVVHVFDRTRGRYRRLQAEGHQPLPSPVGLALALDGRLFVADSKLNQVLVAAHGATVLRALPLQATLSQPTGLAFDDATGRLFVTETGAHRISAFDATGRLIERIGTRGAGSGEFNFPTYLWLDTDRLLVTDSLNFRVQVLDAQHRPTGQLGSLGSAPGNLPRPKGVAMDSGGHVYVVDALLHDLQVFDGSGALLLSLGSQGSGPGEFWLPNGLWIGPDNTIYVADTHNRRVQVFRYTGSTP